ncbi:tail fiber protein [Paenibacillus taichungensis]|uniref:tail fiber protein n=1 Tax=Paenibacillus taichungensis TaxID=484184 RepID=UPI003D9A6815
MPIETNRLKLPLPLGNESVSRVGINAIFEKIDEGVATREDVEELRQLVNQMDIPDASLTQKGQVQLSSKTDGDREEVAATEKAVGLAFQSGVERKAEVVAALNSIGVTASTSETWAQLIPKIKTVIRATGNATGAQVLSGATFSNTSANGLTGTMANRGAGGTVTPGTANQTKAAGYYSSAITVMGDADLVAENILKGINIFGVAGTLVPGLLQQFASSIGVNGTTNGASVKNTVADIPTNKVTIFSSSTGMVLEAMTGNSSLSSDNTTFSGLTIVDAANSAVSVGQAYSSGSGQSVLTYILTLVIEPANRRYRYSYYTQTDRTIRNSGWTNMQAGQDMNTLKLIHTAVVSGTNSYLSRSLINFPDTYMTQV